MQTFLVRRPGIAAGANELDAALTRLRAFEDQPSALPARWLHSYATRDPGGRFGLTCVFLADDASTLHRHAAATGLAAAEILPVTGMRVVRPFASAMVYLLRRRAAWNSPAEIDRGFALMRRVAEERMAGQVKWLRTYTVQEEDGAFGSACLFQAIDPQALRQHAVRAETRADEITSVIGRIVFSDEQRVPAADREAASA